MIRAVDAFHSNIDLWSQVPPVQFGPALEKCDCGANDKNLLTKYQTSDFFVRVLREKEYLLCTKESQSFGHEWTAHPRLEEFRKTLPFSISPGESIFNISEKVRNLTDHGEDVLPESSSDPTEFVRLAIEKRRLRCRFFSIIYGATARLAGYSTRMLSISKEGKRRDHAVSEVYSPQHGKWILIDSDFNIAYRRDGEWLNARELQSAWLTVKNELQSALFEKKPLSETAKMIQQRLNIEVVELGPAGADLRESNMYQASPTGMNLEFYEYVLYSVRNDYLSASYPVGHPKRTREYYLNEEGSKPPPMISPEAYPLSDGEKFYWSVGRSKLQIQHVSAQETPVLRLKATTWTPNFKAFEFRANGTQWNRIDNCEFSIELQAGLNTIEVRSVNSIGLHGEVARLRVSVEPHLNEHSQIQTRGPSSTDDII